MEPSNHLSGQLHFRNVLRFRSPSGHRPVRGQVEFRNVSLQDPASGYAVLKDISFHVRRGTRVGIVGLSGPGTIKLLNLLTRFQGPSSGAVLLDGKDVREYDLARFRRQFSIVPRDPMLLASTVAGNIACADPQASLANVLRAAKLANVHDFIGSLPRGYNTVVGEDGPALSQGERQRLAIARAFLKNAPIVVLDELSTAEDLVAERPVAEALDRLMKGRTTFTIAHRISTLERCDTVLVLNNGALQEVCPSNDHAGVPRLGRPAPNGVPRSVGIWKPGPILVRMDNKPAERPRF